MKLTHSWAERKKKEKRRRAPYSRALYCGAVRSLMKPEVAPSYNLFLCATSGGGVLTFMRGNGGSGVAPSLALLSAMGRVHCCNLAELLELLLMSPVRWKVLVPRERRRDNGGPANPFAVGPQSKCGAALLSARMPAHGGHQSAPIRPGLRCTRGFALFL